MYRKLLMVSAALALFGCEISVKAAEEVISNKVQIQLKGVRGNTGNVILAVFDSEEAFESYENAVAWISVCPGTNRIELSEFPKGKISIAAFHDANENGLHDMRDGVPIEGWGSSGESSQWTAPTFAAALTDTGIVPVQFYYSE